MQGNKTQTRGNQTRDSLLAAALQVFGRDGFHAASTRAIADAAGVNQALIAYHFGGKEGLYLAVFEHITASMTEHMQPLLDALQLEIESLDPGSADGRRACLDIMDRLLQGITRMFGQREAAGWVKLVMREQQDPTEAFDIFFQGPYSQMLEIFTRLIGLLTGQSPQAQATRLLALTQMGQILVFMVGRATTSRHLGWQTVGEAQMKAVHEQVRKNLYAQFDEEVGV
ncbi:MAG: CerR family C-terminal domain-containing protein [Halieaceae bacterium]